MNLLIHSTGQEPAIHGEQVAGDVGSARGSQKDCRAHKFMQLAKASHWRAQKKFTATLCAIQQLSVKFRAKHTRSNGVHAYTILDIDEKLAAQFPYRRAYLPVNRKVDGAMHSR